MFDQFKCVGAREPSPSEVFQASSRRHCVLSSLGVAAIGMIVSAFLIQLQQVTFEEVTAVSIWALPILLLLGMLSYRVRIEPVGQAIPAEAEEYYSNLQESADLDRRCLVRCPCRVTSGLLFGPWWWPSSVVVYVWHLDTTTFGTGNGRWAVLHGYIDRGKGSSDPQISRFAENPRVLLTWPRGGPKVVRELEAWLQERASASAS